MVVALFVKKGFSLAFLVVILGTIVCAATSTSTSTTHTKRFVNYLRSHYSCNGTIGECRMEEELELPMDPEIIRRLLAENGTGVAGKSLDPGAAVGAQCDRNYGSCLPGANGEVKNRCQPYQKCRLGDS